MTTTRFQDFPLADQDRAGDGGAADRRVRRWAGAEDGPTARHRDAHVWCDGDHPDNVTAYKLLIVDIIDGRLGPLTTRGGPCCRPPGRGTGRSGAGTCPSR